MMRTASLLTLGISAAGAAASEETPRHPFLNMASKMRELQFSKNDHEEGPLFEGRMLPPDKESSSESSSEQPIESEYNDLTYEVSHHFYSKNIGYLATVVIYEDDVFQVTMDCGVTGNGAVVNVMATNTGDLPITAIRGNLHGVQWDIIDPSESRIFNWLGYVDDDLGDDYIGLNGVGNDGSIMLSNGYFLGLEGESSTYHQNYNLPGHYYYNSIDNVTPNSVCGGSGFIQIARPVEIYDPVNDDDKAMLFGEEVGLAAPTTASNSRPRSAKHGGYVPSDSVAASTESSSNVLYASAAGALMGLLGGLAGSFVVMRKGAGPIKHQSVPMVDESMSASSRSSDRTIAPTLLTEMRSNGMI